MTVITEMDSRKILVSRPPTLDLHTISIRPIRPDDIDLISQMHQRLSADTVFYRYLQYRIPSLEELDTLCRISSNQGRAFVAVSNPIGEKIVGVACYVCEPARVDRAEVGILVEDQFQGYGVGRMLWQALHQHAQANQIQHLRVLFDPSNYRVLRLIKSSGYAYHASTEEGLNDFLVSLKEEPRLSRIKQLLEEFGRPVLQRLVANRSGE